MTAPLDGAPGTLYHVLFKVNCNNKGYQQKHSIINVTPSGAQTSAVAVATAYKRILPGDAEIFYAIISNYNTGRDSKFLRAAQGPGRFQTAAGPPIVLAKFDASFTGIKLRLEADFGGSRTICVNPVPDGVVTDEEIIPTINDVTATFAAADPVDGDLLVFEDQFLSFMQILTKHTVHVLSGAVPGGAFRYSPITAAYPIGVMKKKGSRAFI